MSKVCVLGDLHFGARGDSIHFLMYFKSFFDNILFPYLRENGIKTIIQLGDIFDKRKTIDINTLTLSKEFFFNKLVEEGIEMISLVGNHDTYYKNTNEINSQEKLLSEYSNIKVCKEFCTISVGDIDLDIIAWICQGNEESITEKIRESKSQVCFGHLELNGFQVYRGNYYNKSKYDSKILNKYDMVITGHFHHKSDNGHIFYTGTPYEITWNDYNDPKGFHIFDVSTRDLEFVRNPDCLFHKITYDDTDGFDPINFNYDDYVGKFVKIVVVNKSDHFLFDIFIDNLEKAGVYDIKIVEDFTQDSGEEECIDEGEDTLTILSKVIDSTDLDVDPNDIKLIMKEIYIEALEFDRGE